MVDCNKCIHYDVCEYTPHSDICAHPCTYFQDKDCMFESPCALGSTLYIRVYSNKKDKNEFGIRTVTVVGLHLKDEKGYRDIPRQQYIVARTPYGMSEHIAFNRLGKDVFLTYEEAQERSNG